MSFFCGICCYSQSSMLWAVHLGSRLHELHTEPYLLMLCGNCISVIEIELLTKDQRWGCGDHFISKMQM